MIEVQVGERPSLSVGLGWRRLIAEEEQDDTLTSTRITGDWIKGAARCFHKVNQIDPAGGWCGFAGATEDSGDRCR
jgi:hypothetical protein